MMVPLVRVSHPGWTQREERATNEQRAPTLSVKDQSEGTAGLTEEGSRGRLPRSFQPSRAGRELCSRRRGNYIVAPRLKRLAALQVIIAADSAF